MTARPKCPGASPPADQIGRRSLALGLEREARVDAAVARHRARDVVVREHPRRGRVDRCVRGERGPDRGPHRFRLPRNVARHRPGQSQKPQQSAGHLHPRAQKLPKRTKAGRRKSRRKILRTRQTPPRHLVRPLRVPLTGMKAPSTNIQAPMIKPQTSKRCRESLGTWNLELGASLELGAWTLGASKTEL